MDTHLAGGSALDVSDSTDWLGTPLACLMPVEAAFRCHVCKDFYDSPMLTSCNHTFCSVCIRRCLSADGKCPLCRKTDQASKLRGNWALREARDAFVACRSALLEFARKPAAAPVAFPKRKAAELDEDEDEEEVQEPANKRTRISTRSSARRGAAAIASMAQAEADQEESSEPADAYTSPNDGLVACPICWSRMKEAEVSRHIDTSCPGSPSKAKPQPTKTAPIQNSFLAPKPKKLEPAKTPERLPGLAYSMLKDQALRKKLMDLGINSYGSRQHLERRHKEWVTLWNANCDSAHPKTREQLLQDLDVWERTVGTGTRSLGVYGQQQAPQVKDKNFDGSAWASKHDDSFKDLIAKARGSKQKAEQKARETTPPVAAPPTPETSEPARAPQTSEPPREPPTSELSSEPQPSAREEESRPTLQAELERNAPPERSAAPSAEQGTWSQDHPWGRHNSYPTSYPTSYSTGYPSPYTDSRPTAQFSGPHPYTTSRPTTHFSTDGPSGITPNGSASATPTGAGYPPSTFAHLHHPQQGASRSREQSLHDAHTAYLETANHHLPQMENGRLPPMVNGGPFSQPLLAPHQGLEHLPGLRENGFPSQPSPPAPQHGVDQPPSFSSSFDNLMSKRLSQEPSPSITDQGPFR